MPDSWRRAAPASRSYRPHWLAKNSPLSWLSNRSSFNCFPGSFDFTPIPSAPCIPYPHFNPPLASPLLSSLSMIHSASFFVPSPLFTHFWAHFWNGSLYQQPFIIKVTTFQFLEIQRTKTVSWTSFFSIFCLFTISFSFFRVRYFSYIHIDLKNTQSRYQLV